MSVGGDGDEGDDDGRRYDEGGWIRGGGEGGGGDCDGGGGGDGGALGMPGEMDKLEVEAVEEVEKTPRTRFSGRNGPQQRPGCHGNVHRPIISKYFAIQGQFIRLKQRLDKNKKKTQSLCGLPSRSVHILPTLFMKIKNRSSTINRGFVSNKGDKNGCPTGTATRHCAKDKAVPLVRLYGALAPLAQCFIIIIIMGCIYGGGTGDQAGLHSNSGVCEQTPPLLALLRGRHFDSTRPEA